MNEINFLDSDLLYGVKDQLELEHELENEANRQLNENKLINEEKRLEKTNKKLQNLYLKLDNIDKKKDSINNDVRRSKILKEIESLNADKHDINARILNLKNDGLRKMSHSKDIYFLLDSNENLNNNSKEFLIKSGKLTPFSLLDEKFNHDISDFENEVKLEKKNTVKSDSEEEVKLTKNSISYESDSDFQLDIEGKLSDDDDNFVENDELEKTQSEENLIKDNTVTSHSTFIDDGDEREYKNRLKKFVVQKRLEKLRNKYGDKFDMEKVNFELLEQDLIEEMYQENSNFADVKFEGNFSIPGTLHAALFDYQITCIKWLWELYSQEIGGIVGDEMGLGKTIQIIAFLASLGYSNLLKGPVLIVVPATVLRQWATEFQKWWPYYRVIILHSSGSGMSAIKNIISDDDGDCDSTSELEVKEYTGESRNKKKLNMDSDFDSESSEGLESGKEQAEEDEFSDSIPKKRKKNFKKPNKKKFVKAKVRSQHSMRQDQKVQLLVDRIVKSGHVLVTTYAAIRIHRATLLKVKWAYCVLDEGHKIRNPDSDITITCKQIKTPHRIILSGTPIQNNLSELWSLYDFVFPGRLGTLPIFQTEFAVPINIGGYANATNIQVQTAYKCAVVLRDTISPYLLRRLKKDVAQDLPKKSEQVLFCRLTPLQKKLYQQFCHGEEVENIILGKRNALYGIDILRKICNHPDLLDRKVLSASHDYGSEEKSCKMLVVKSLLKMWKEGGSKTLLFVQTRQMQDILEKFLQKEGYKFLRMDGNTAIKNRQGLVDTFNNDPLIDLFLLTTKVGGLGLNLIGASRVLIFDPDWNPSTDIQARERAWRVGQKKDVTIYRLMTSGTIEEKIYHRQIFKTFLTNKVLEDPKQQRFFKQNDIHDLFKLNLPEEGENTETGDLFGSSIKDVEVMKKLKTNKTKKKKITKNNDSVDKLKKIKLLDKVSEFKGNQQEEEAGSNSDMEDELALDGEDQILKSLFKKSGVHSALKHDSIVGVHSLNREKVLVEKEATLIAEQAIAALKACRKKMRVQVGVPTWTGKFGSVGAPKSLNPKRFGNKKQNSKDEFGTKKVFQSPSKKSLSSFSSFSKFTGINSGFQPKNNGNNGNAVPSSSSILNNIRLRNLESIPKEDEVDVVNESKEVDLVKDIRNFLSLKTGHKAKSKEIVDKFKLNIKNDEVLIFRKMLKGIANFNKKEGEWVLKEDFL